MNYLTYSQIMFANWHTLDAQDRARADRIGQ